MIRGGRRLPMVVITMMIPVVVFLLLLLHYNEYGALPIHLTCSDTCCKLYRLAIAHSVTDRHTYDSMMATADHSVC